jgi:MerR family copper efflux transcriptional regulator
MVDLRQAGRTSREGERLTIGRLALLSGVSAKAIRYYESVGLLPPAKRSANGYRSYSRADLNRLILLRRLRLLGVSLEALKPLLEEAPHARCVEVQQETLRLIEERLRAIDQEIAELHLLRDQVEHYHKQLLVCYQDAQEQLLACYPDAEESFGDCRDLSCLAGKSEAQRKEEMHVAVSSLRRHM